MNMSTCPSRGFTLLEVSIVLVVIALIAGGIVVGRSVVRNAEIQGLIADVDRFRRAANLFREKYNYLPGDYPNGAGMWGTDAGCNSAVFPNADATASNAVRKKETCGGNGNGFVAGYNGGAQWPTAATVGSTVVNREALRAWQHMANAGFLEGAYSGAPSSSASNGYEGGVNLPRGRLSDVNGFAFFHASPIHPDGTNPGGVAVPSVYPGKYGHVIAFGKARGEPIRQGPARPGMTGDEAAQVDGRIDDGRPGTGHVVGFTPDISSYSPNCTTSANAAVAAYRSAESGVRCSLVFITGL